MTKSISSLLLFTLLFFASCIHHRDLLSLQNSAKEETLTHTTTDYLLQEGDVLSIKVSSLDPESVAIFNKTVGQTNSSQASEIAIYINSYIINDSGMVNLPIIGDIKLKGLTIMNAKSLLAKEMNVYYKFSTVDIKLMSFRVTVLGEVMHQGTFVFYNPTANILQAIGEAGGITDLGNRSKIRVIRQTKGESKVSSYIDLYSDQFIKSEYYQLQPNDVIYIEPSNAKSKRLNLPAIQAVLAGLTFVIVIITFIQRQ